MREFFSVLFRTTAGPNFPGVELYLGAFSLLILASVLFFLYLRMSSMPNTIKNALRGIPSWLLGFGIAGYMLVFFRLSAVPFLSMRFLYVVLLGCFLWYVVATITHLSKELPKKHAALAKKREREAKAPLIKKKKKK